MSAQIRHWVNRMATTHQIIIGDARNMEQLADQSVHLVITSPPYWQLKDYGAGGQIGFDDTYESYINHLNLVWNEGARVLHPGCRLCINVGDQFARSAYYGRYKVIPIRTEIIRFCETIGFDYMGAVIWQKVTSCNTTGGATVMGSFPYPRNGVLKIDYEFILLFKKHGKAPRAEPAVKEASRMSAQTWNEYFSGHWRFPGERQGDKHLAAFPEELPKRLITMFSFPGETVLDPFLGSGTTSVAALNLGRNSVGYEINEAYLPGIEKRLRNAGGAAQADPVIDVKRSDPGSFDWEKALAGLPYRFEDPVSFERKVDPRKRRYGSRVDARAPGARETYFRVKRVRSPSVLELDDGQTVRLLGVKKKAQTRKAAVDFLEQKTRGQRVYLRFDQDAHGCDEQGNRFCYLYLQNRTFINRHLVRTGSVSVDTAGDYRMKQSFLDLVSGGMEEGS